MLRRPWSCAVVLPALLLAACERQYENPFSDRSSAVPPPVASDLLFTGNGYTTRTAQPREVFAVADDGAGLTRLTFCNTDPKRCDAVEAAPAPDRRRLVVRRIGADTNRDGRLTSADGEALVFVDLARAVEAEILPASSHVSGIDWSIEGDVLVFSGNGQGDLEDLFRMDVNGMNIGPLTSTPEVRERRPRIDPGVTSAVYERIDASGKGQIYVFGSSGLPVPVTTGGPGTELLPGTPYRVGSDADPDYSPDGRSVVFRRCTGTGTAGLGTWDVLIVALNGTGLRVLASGPQYRGAPDWGTQGIVFQEVDAAAASSRLVVIQPDGSGRRTPVTMGSAFELSYPRWLQ